jgi:hypothetical protein
MHGVVNRFIVGLAQLLRVPHRPVKAVRPDFALGLASCLKNEGFLDNSPQNSKAVFTVVDRKKTAKIAVFVWS